MAKNQNVFFNLRPNILLLFYVLVNFLPRFGYLRWSQRPRNCICSVDLHDQCISRHRVLT